MKNKIYINPENEEFGDFFELESGLVSWNNESMSANDLQYISVDFILAEIERLKKNTVYGEINYESLVIIEAFKNLIK